MHKNTEDQKSIQHPNRASIYATYLPPKKQLLKLYFIFLKLFFNGTQKPNQSNTTLFRLFLMLAHNTIPNKPQYAYKNFIVMKNNNDLFQSNKILYQNKYHLIKDSQISTINDKYHLQHICQIEPSRPPYGFFLMPEPKLMHLRRPMTGLSVIDFKPTESLLVMMNQYAISHASSTKPVIGTFGAGPCLILALYSNNDKKAALAHIDSLIDIDSLERIFKEFQPEDTVAHLYGGKPETKELCRAVAMHLEWRQIEIKNADIITDEQHVASLAIDARTGKIYKVEPKHLEPLQKCELDYRTLYGVYGVFSTEHWPFRPLINVEKVIKEFHKSAWSGKQHEAKQEMVIPTYRQ